jgi:RNA polymerase sigma factor (TIGR02999 family)
MTGLSITDLLHAWSAGDDGAPDRLLPLLYQFLHDIAARHLRREAVGHTLTPTALVHEAWMRLAAQTRLTINDRTHFLALASGAMRRVLVDHARRRLADKRVAPPPLESFDLASASADEWAVTVIAVHDALDRLRQVDERLYRVVECRFFGGLTEDETAEVLGVSVRTVHRDWLKARGWLLMALRD